MAPASANGKVCYIEMPATDIRRSADFYQTVFGWRVRTRGDGRTAFDDSTGEVSGTWILGRPPSAEPGLLFYIMVDDLGATVDAIVRQGCAIVQPVGADAPEVNAQFRFPAILFMTALVVRSLQPQQYEPAHTAERIVRWFAASTHVGLWVLLMALPSLVLVTGCATLASGWNSDAELRRVARRALAAIRAHLATLIVAAATLNAGGVLAIVAVH